MCEQVLWTSGQVNNYGDSHGFESHRYLSIGTFDKRISQFRHYSRRFESCRNKFTYSGPFDKWFKSTPFHGVVTGSNPVGVIRKMKWSSIVALYERFDSVGMVHM